MAALAVALAAALLTIALAWLALLERLSAALDDRPWAGAALAWASVAPVVLAIGLTIAWQASKRRQLRRAAARVQASAERLGIAELSGLKAGPYTRHDDVLAEPLERLAALHQSTSAVLLDRDAQLATMRSLGGLLYFECDAQGRYTRIELPAQARRPELAQLIGHHPWDLGAMLTDGRDWDACRQRLERREGYSEVLIRRIDAGGSPYVMSESAAPRLAADGTLLGWAGVMREVTAEEQLRRERALALAALQTSGEPTLLVRADAAQGWGIGWANAAACRLLDRSGSELTELRDGALLGADNRLLAARLEDALRAGCGLKMQVAIPDRYGASVTVQLRFDPLPGEERARLGVVTLDPIGPELESLRRAVTEARQHRQDAAARALEHEVVARELESFSYTVSHDLRAPLRVVEGFARIVREDYGTTLDRMANEHLDRVLNATSRMNMMIDALLSMARLTSRPIVPERVDLSRLAASVVDELANASPQREVKVSIQAGMDARGDSTLLRVVLQNLLGNAWKYSERVEDAEIGFGTERDGERTVYCVSDNGAGFDMRHADRLFTPFQRLHTASEFPGTGIGLASVQRIIRRHGGRIWARSEPGAGARFHFTLWDPVEDDED